MCIRDRHATTHGERALALARELGLAEETAYLLNDLGEALGSLGRMEEARAMMGEAVAHWRALGNEPMLADGLTGLANWTGFGGDLTGARASAEEANAINTRIGNPWGQAYSGAVRSLIRSLPVSYTHLSRARPRRCRLIVSCGGGRASSLAASR